MITYATPGEFVTQQTFREPIEVTAADVTFSECRFTSDGSFENALLSLESDRGAIGTKVLGCELLAGYTLGHRRGIMVNAPNVVIERLTAYNMHHQDDAWCIAGWDNTINLQVRDCQLEASGETIIFGGATTKSAERIPQDILIENCTFIKPSSWKTQANTNVKNLFEIKCGKRITVRNVRMFGCWPAGQAGFTILVTVRNQDNDSPWVTCEDITFSGIMAREVACGLQIDGHDKNPNEGVKRLTIENSQFHLNAPDGKLIQIGGGAEDVTIRKCHFWADNPNSWLTFHDDPLVNFRMEDCDCNEGWYGARGDGRACGTDSIEHYAPGALFQNVLLWGQPGVSYPYPAGITVNRSGASRESGSPPCPTT